MNENEKVYKSMGFAGVIAITTGIILLTVGIAAGILMLISGGRLMADRGEMII